MASAEPESDADALRRLQERLDRAAAAAERLLGDTVTAAGVGGGGGAGASDDPAPTSVRPGDGPGIPPAGWQQPAPDDRAGSAEPGAGPGSGEIELLLAVIASVRDHIPPELQRRLADAVREVLLAIRALIDWYLERTERQGTEPAQVQDIPIL